MSMDDTREATTKREALRISMDDTRVATLRISMDGTSESTTKTKMALNTSANAEPLGLLPAEVQPLAPQAQRQAGPSMAAQSSSVEVSKPKAQPSWLNAAAAAVDAETNENPKPRVSRMSRCVGSAVAARVAAMETQANATAQGAPRSTPSTPSPPSPRAESSTQSSLDAAFIWGQAAASSTNGGGQSPGRSPGLASAARRVAVAHKARSSVIVDMANPVGVVAPLPALTASNPFMPPAEKTLSSAVGGGVAEFIMRGPKPSVEAGGAGSSSSDLDPLASLPLSVPAAPAAVNDTPAARSPRVVGVRRTQAPLDDSSTIMSASAAPSAPPRCNPFQPIAPTSSTPTPQSNPFVPLAEVDAREQTARWLDQTAKPDTPTNESLHPSPNPFLDDSGDDGMFI